MRNVFVFRALLLSALIIIPSIACSSITKSIDHCNYNETDISDRKIAGLPFHNPDEIKSVNGVLNATLDVIYTNPKKTSIAGCGVKLRSYNGKLVGPTLRVKPGDVINLTINNKLPNSTGKEGAAQCANPNHHFGGSEIPTNFNCTNIHTHGLHVSPYKDKKTDNFSDNIFTQIGPSYQNPTTFTIRIPENHAKGTFWYHPHIHGSTGIQVASGMQGAIIVEDNIESTPQAINAANKNEKIFMLQTIPYNDKGEIESFLALGDDRAFVRNRYLLVNGQIAPTIKLHPGEVQRWRFIGSSFNRTVLLQLENHDLHEIALDGNYLPQVDTWVNNGPRKISDDDEEKLKLKSQFVELVPGSRSDILVKGYIKPGRYKLTATTFITGRLNPAKAAIKTYVVAWVDIRGKTMDMALPSDDDMAALVPYKTIEKSDIHNHQIVDFNVDAPAAGDDGNFPCNADKDDVPCYPISFQINGRVFNPGQPRLLKLGQADAWTVTTKDLNRAHVFHIHTNAFQTTRTRPNGEPGIVWRDTLFVAHGNPKTFFTRYEDFTGKFVLHCHILAHEDMGMMEAVEVKDEISAGHHH